MTIYEPEPDKDKDENESEGNEVISPGTLPPGPYLV